MAFFAPSVTTEADALFTYLEQQCTQLKLTALDLTDEQARSIPTTSPLSIAGLLAHAAQVLNGWLLQVKEPERYIDEEEYPTINDGLGLDGMFDGSAVPDLDIAEVVVILRRASPKSSWLVRLSQSMEPIWAPWFRCRAIPGCPRTSS